MAGKSKNMHSKDDASHKKGRCWWEQCQAWELAADGPIHHHFNVQIEFVGCCNTYFVCTNIVVEVQLHTAGGLPFRRMQQGCFSHLTTLRIRLPIHTDAARMLQPPHNHAHHHPSEACFPFTPPPPHSPLISEGPIVAPRQTVVQDRAWS